EPVFDPPDPEPAFEPALESDLDPSFGLLEPSNARRRNAAIWPRDTRSSGQNRSFFGGLQPFVIPAAANAAMSAAWTFPFVSENPDFADFRFRARTRNVAI